jgi:hypothetical protein
VCFPPLRRVRCVHGPPWVLVESLPPWLGPQLADAGPAAIAARVRHLRGDRVQLPLPREPGTVEADRAVLGLVQLCGL